MLGVSVGEVESMDARLSGLDLSLNGTLNNEDGDRASERMDFLVDDGAWPDAIVEQMIDAPRRTSQLQEAFGVLNEREMKILQKRRLEEQSATLEAVGRTSGFPRSAFGKSKIAPLRNSGRS